MPYVAIIQGAVSIIQSLEPYIKELLSKGEISVDDANYALAHIDAIKAIQRAGGPKGPEWIQSNRTA